MTAALRWPLWRDRGPVLPRPLGGTWDQRQQWEGPSGVSSIPQPGLSLPCLCPSVERLLLGSLRQTAVTALSALSGQAPRGQASEPQARSILSLAQRSSCCLPPSADSEASEGRSPETRASQASSPLSGWILRLNLLLISGLSWSSLFFRHLPNSLFARQPCI